MCVCACSEIMLGWSSHNVWSTLVTVGLSVLSLWQDPATSFHCLLVCPKEVDCVKWSFHDIRQHCIQMCVLKHNMHTHTHTNIQLEFLHLVNIFESHQRDTTSWFCVFSDNFPSPQQEVVFSCVCVYSDYLSDILACQTVAWQESLKRMLHAALRQDFSI